MSQDELADVLDFVVTGICDSGKLIFKGDANERAMLGRDRWARCGPVAGLAWRGSGGVTLLCLASQGNDLLFLSRKWGRRQELEWSLFGYASAHAMLFVVLKCNELVPAQRREPSHSACSRRRLQLC